MNRAVICSLVLMLMLSCNTHVDRTAGIVEEEQEVPKFFPVTNYIYGQIEAIKKASVNPFRVDSINNKSDTSWLKIEALDTAFIDFLTPVIDSTNLIGFFTESKFEDQTLDSYTFTYAAKTALPHSIALQRWDVYISPATNSIKRIFMVKKISDQQELQLTWQSGQWCKKVTINTNANGQQSISAVQTIKWNFD